MYKDNLQAACARIASLEAELKRAKSSDQTNQKTKSSLWTRFYAWTKRKDCLENWFDEDLSFIMSMLVPFVFVVVIIVSVMIVCHVESVVNMQREVACVQACMTRNVLVNSPFDTRLHEHYIRCTCLDSNSSKIADKIIEKPAELFVK